MVRSTRVTLYTCWASEINVHSINHCHCVISDVGKTSIITNYLNVPTMFNSTIGVNLFTCQFFSQNDAHEIKFEVRRVFILIFSLICSSKFVDIDVENCFTLREQTVILPIEACDASSKHACRGRQSWRRIWRSESDVTRHMRCRTRVFVRSVRQTWLFV